MAISQWYSHNSILSLHRYYPHTGHPCSQVYDQRFGLWPPVKFLSTEGMRRGDGIVFWFIKLNYSIKKLPIMTNPTQYPVHSANSVDIKELNTPIAELPVHELTGDAFKAEAEKAQRIIEERHKNTTLEAGEQAFNPAEIRLATDRRDSSRAPARANEATDRNDTGTGGIPAGGAKTGSSLQ